ATMSSGGPGPEELSGHADREVEQLLASPELVKAIEHEEFKAFLDHLPIGVVVARISAERQSIVYANGAFAKLTGQSGAEAEGKDWSILDGLAHEDDPGAPLGRLAVTGEDFLGVFRMERAGQEPLLVQAYTSVIEEELSDRSYRILALVDVTRHDRAQREEFERTIRSRDLLLRELQHRVKNNLQLLVVLVRLEARTAQRGDPVDLERLSGRIEALSLLHDTLSMEPSAREVDLGHYLAQIAAAAMRAHASEAITLDVKVNYCPVSVNVAMPAGFLVNELLTNAFKYAFLGRDGGCITVECLRDEDGRYRILVADDGVGLPAGMTWPPADKLGAFVLQALSENVTLDFRVESAPGQGVRVTLAFLHEAAVARPN
ncbi:MAG TPA: histidine kinase dimerization/phosphoacceptor domain -containing protein, partial [Afifellaceae bacterium]|nr:histidine kinase dimerization/phosphoacceptor domain -containing protein [Afifellaceae bacterium]